VIDSIRYLQKPTKLNKIFESVVEKFNEADLKRLVQVWTGVAQCPTSRIYVDYEHIEDGFLRFATCSKTLYLRKGACQRLLPAAYEVVSIL